LNNPKETQEKLIRFVDIDEWKYNTNKCNQLYIERGYELMNSIKIYDRVIKLIGDRKQLGGVKKELFNDKSNIQFILFTDVMTGYKSWFRDLDDNKINFVDKLKNMGNVIIPKPNYVNFMRYSKIKPNQADVNRLFASKKGEINFTIDDLQFENYADWVYDQINPNIKYIAIGLDQGAHFAKFFANKFSDQCLALFVLTDRLFTKESFERTFESENNYNYIKSIVGDNWQKYLIKNITNETIVDLLQKITNDENNNDYINLLNAICKGIIRSQYYKIKKMNIKTIIYSDAETLTSEKINLNKEFSEISDNNVIYYYIIDNAHYLIYGKYSNEIYERILGLINNFEQKKIQQGSGRTIH